MIDHYLVALLTFLAGYTLSLTYVTIFYHRAFTHRAPELHPRTRRFIAATGTCITGLDLARWVCMHRMHHAFADGPEDPHSPSNVGIIGVALEQLRSYERALVGITRKNSDYTRFISDLEFGVHRVNRRRVWYLPYVLHMCLGVVLGLGTGSWLIGLAYVLGIVSYPFQAGWSTHSGIPLATGLSTLPTIPGTTPWRACSSWARGIRTTITPRRAPLGSRSSVKKSTSATRSACFPDGRACRRCAGTSSSPVRPRWSPVSHEVYVGH